MQGWLIYHENDVKENKSYIDWFIMEANKQGINLILICRHRLTIGIEDGIHITYKDGVKTSLPDFVVIRTIDPFLQLFFEAQQIPLFNDAKTAGICNDKARTYMELNTLQIPFVPTYFLSKKYVPETLPLSYPFVLKQSNGRGGKEVFYAKHEKDFHHAIDQLSKEEFIIQSADVQLGRDVRVFIIGKKIIAAVLRKNDHDFRANFKLGGDAILYELSDEEESIIMQIVNHFNFGLVGIDFLIGQNGELLFNEIEDVVGSRILSETTRINLLKEYVQFIKNSVNKSL